VILPQPSPPENPSDDPARIYVLPNLMTAGNLICGFCAVLLIFQGTLQREAGASPEVWAQSFTQSLYLIFAAFLFDMLDGRLARLGGKESAFGREFDSLADLISFGMAPALLVFQIVLADFGKLAWILAGLYLLCGALRLARFNAMATTNQNSANKEFTGFPIPAAAGLIASITLLLLSVERDHGQVSLGYGKYGLAALMVLLSMMMFSKFKYPSFKHVGWRTHFSIPKFILLIGLIVLTLFYLEYMIAVLFVGYLLYGFLRPFISRAWRRELGDEEEEHEEEPYSRTSSLPKDSS